MTKGNPPMFPYVMGAVEVLPRIEIRKLLLHDGRTYMMRGLCLPGGRMHVDVLDESTIVRASGPTWESAAMAAANLKGQTNDGQ